MYKNILVPMALDHGVGATALKVAQALLADGGSISALHVYEAPQGSVSAFLDEDTVRAAFDAADKRLRERVSGMDNVTPTLIKGHAARSVVDHANEIGADLIVIGSHQPGIKDFFLGSTASWVVRHAPCAVHVIRNTG